MKKQGFRAGFVTYFRKNKKIFGDFSQEMKENILKKVRDGLKGFRSGLKKAKMNLMEIAKKVEKSLKNGPKTFKRAYLATYTEVATTVNQSKVVRPVVIGTLAFLLGFTSGKLFSPVITTEAVSGPESTPIVTEELTGKEVAKKAEVAEISQDTGYALATSAQSTSVSTSVATTSVSTNTTTSTAALQIPSIGLYTGVANTYVDTNNDIVVPGYGVGVLTSYGNRHFTLLVGHRAGIFSNLPAANLGDTIIYQGKTYKVTTKYQQNIRDINMYALTSTSYNTVRIMTCAGVNNSERLVVIAELVQ